MSRLLVALFVILSATAIAQEKLQVGDKAPPIEISHWVKGEPVGALAAGRVYVIEFWATWCGPCIGSMPHMSALQKKYGDKATFIAVSNEPLATVVKWLCKTDPQTGKLYFERPQYRLTCDPDKSVEAAYFTAAGQRGIPCAFIVGKDTRVEWIGHPMSMDGPLAKVVDGTWDREAWKAENAQRAAMMAEFGKAQKQLQVAMAAQQWDQALVIMEDLKTKFPAYALNFDIQKFHLLLKQLNRPQDAYKVGAAIAKSNWENANLLNQLAWTVVDDKDVKTRDLGFAMRLAVQANKLTESKNAAILDTLARVHYEQGSLEGAVEWQRRAVQFAGKDKMGQEIRAVLEKYLAEAAKRAAKKRPESEDM